MRENYRGNKMRREALKKQKQEAKRLKRLNRKQEDPSTPPADEMPAESDPTSVPPISG